MNRHGGARLEEWRKGHESQDVIQMEMGEDDIDVQYPLLAKLVAKLPDSRACIQNHTALTCLNLETHCAAPKGQKSAA